MDERKRRKERPAQPRDGGGRFAATDGARRVLPRDDVPVGGREAVRVVGRAAPSRKEYERLSAELDASQKRVRELEGDNAILRRTAYSPLGLSYKMLFDTSVRSERRIRALCVRARVETDGMIRAYDDRIAALKKECARWCRECCDARSRAAFWRARFRVARILALLAFAVSVAASAFVLARGFGG